MKLNIYNKKQVVKTYEVDSYDLMWGVVEDIADAIKIDDMKTGSNDEIVKMAVNLVITAKDTVNDLMKDVFDGLTDDELRNTKVSELASVLVDVVMYAIGELGKGSKGKN